MASVLYTEIYLICIIIVALILFGMDTVFGKMLELLLKI